jgi:hypothetical protein
MSLVRKKLHQTCKKLKTLHYHIGTKKNSAIVCFIAKTNWHSFTDQGYCVKHFLNSDKIHFNSFGTLLSGQSKIKFSKFKISIIKN